MLEALATAEGDLLEDTSLIERLSETKATAAEIQVSATPIFSISSCVDSNKARSWGRWIPNHPKQYTRQLTALLRGRSPLPSGHIEN